MLCCGASPLQGKSFDMGVSTSGVPYLVVLIIRILLIGVLCYGPLLSETPIWVSFCESQGQVKFRQPRAGVHGQRACGVKLFRVKDGPKALQQGLNLESLAEIEFLLFDFPSDAEMRSVVAASAPALLVSAQKRQELQRHRRRCLK